MPDLSEAGSNPARPHLQSVFIVPLAYQPPEPPRAAPVAAPVVHDITVSPQPSEPGDPARTFDLPGGKSLAAWQYRNAADAAQDNHGFLYFASYSGREIRSNDPARINRFANLAIADALWQAENSGWLPSSTGAPRHLGHRWFGGK